MAECAAVGVFIADPAAEGGDPAAVVLSPPLRMAGAGLASRVCGCALSLQVLWLGAAQGPGGFPARRTTALRRALRISCTRAACAAWASVSVRMAGCSCSPSASARIWWLMVLDNTPVLISPAVGPTCLAGPFARPLADPLRGRGGSGGMTGPGVGLPLSLLQAGRGGPGSAAPAPGMWEEVVGISFVSDTTGC